MPRAAENPTLPPRPVARWTRWGGASVLVLAGALLIVLARAWSGIEATLSAQAISVVTGETTIAGPAHLLILYKGSVVQSVFVLTSECSVAYLLAAMFIGSAPLMLLRRLSPWRTALAATVAAAVLELVNVGRLTAIGVVVSGLGLDPGLQIAHTYLGSLLTVIGTFGAGLTLAALLVMRRHAHAPASG